MAGEFSDTTAPLCIPIQMERRQWFLNSVSYVSPICIHPIARAIVIRSGDLWILDSEISPQIDGAQNGRFVRRFGIKKFGNQQQASYSSLFISYESHSYNLLIELKSSLLSDLSNRCRRRWILYIRFDCYSYFSLSSPVQVLIGNSRILHFILDDIEHRPLCYYNRFVGQWPGVSQNERTQVQRESNKNRNAFGVHWSSHRRTEWYRILYYPRWQIKSTDEWGDVMCHIYLYCVAPNIRRLFNWSIRCMK